MPLLLSLDWLRQEKVDFGKILLRGGVKPQINNPSPLSPYTPQLYIQNISYGNLSFLISQIKKVKRERLWTKQLKLVDLFRKYRTI